MNETDTKKAKFLGIKAQCPEGHLIVDDHPRISAWTEIQHGEIWSDSFCEACNKVYIMIIDRW